jgi:predicted DNA-binding transcriptional regulator YafY
VLALRLAQDATPTYAPLFARQAHDLAQTLSPAERAALDDLWLGLEPPAAEEDPLPDGEEPRSPLDPAALRATLQRAIAEGQRLRLRYYTASRHVVGWRTVSPLALRPLYLDAYCLRRRETLTFCLARILAVEGAASDGAPLPPEPPVSPAPVPAVWLAEDYDER